jgi:hypothetical protein
MIGCAVFALSTSAWAAGGISGGPHDLSGVNTNGAYAWNTRKGTCTPCHSAHFTDDAQIAPLWAHGTSAATFTPYSSPTLNASVGQPSGNSLACLSCHDGTVALNQGISAKIGSSSAALEYIDAAAEIGTDLHTTHPISFTYNGGLAAADGGLEDPDAYHIGDAKSSLSVSTAPVPTSWSGTSLTGKTISQALLIGGKMECSSCHDVHKMEGSAPTSGIMVRISGSDVDGRGSLICRTCHKK